MINPYRKASAREIQYKDKWVASVAMPWFEVVLATMRVRFGQLKGDGKRRIVRKVGDMGACVEL